MRLNTKPYELPTGVKFEYHKNSGTIKKLFSPKLNSDFNNPIKQKYGN